MGLPPDDDDTSGWKPPGRQLRIDGRVTGDLPVAPQPAAVPEPPAADPSGLPSLDALTTSELVLDRSRSGKPGYVEPGPYRDLVVPSRGRPWKWVLLLMVLAGAALATFVLFPGLQRRLPLPVATKGTLIIHSEPSGATVKIAGQVVGQTPWAADNLWGGEVKYELSANGYKSKWGTFRGGDNVQLSVKLSKK